MSKTSETNVIAREEFLDCLKQSEQGNTDALYLVGLSYFLGKGVRKNRRNAVKLWTKAAENGHTDAQCWLAECYECGLGTSKNIVLAYDWWRTAAANGSVRAMMAIVWAYLIKRNDENIRIIISKAEAMNCCKTAAEKGNYLAKKILKSSWFKA